MECTWHWTVEQFDQRTYKVVRGENAGGTWKGERGSGERINPMDYVPKKFR